MATKRVIVNFKAGNVSANADVVTTAGGDIVQVMDAVNMVSANIDESKIEELKKNPNIKSVEITTSKDVSTLGFKSDWMVTKDVLKLILSNQVTPWGILKIKATDVQSGGNKGTGIKVCVEDTGIDYTHEDIKGNYKGGYNFVSNNNDPMDDFGHGTHVAGTIAAMDNDVGVIGVAPEAYLYAIKVLDSNGSGSYDNIVAGINWCINSGIQVINMSFGGSSYSQALDDACTTAKNKGIVIVAAAGNSDGDGSQDTVGYPAKLSAVIAIAATDQNDNRSSFSSCGPEVWVSAPGSNVLSTVPKGSCALCDPTGYKYLNGTSMATPHAAGTVALMIKANPNLTPDDIKTTLGNTSIDLGAPGKDVFFGNGRIDASKATGSPTPPPPPPPQKTYNCSGAPDYQCVEAPSGTTGKFPDITSCQTACKAPQPPPQPTAKFMVIPLGNTGVTVLNEPFGQYDADAACITVCQMIKSIASGDKVSNKPPTHFGIR